MILGDILLVRSKSVWLISPFWVGCCYLLSGHTSPPPTHRDAGAHDWRWHDTRLYSGTGEPLALKWNAWDLLTRCLVRSSVNLVVRSRNGSRYSKSAGNQSKLWQNPEYLPGYRTGISATQYASILVADLVADHVADLVAELDYSTS